MNSTTKRSIARWIHLVFGLMVAGYIYGPQEEVAQYVNVHRYVIMPVVIITGLWMWKGHVIGRIFSKRSD